MPSIKENLSKITNEINLLKKEAKEAADNTKSIGNSLKLDKTNNITLVQDRFASLSKELEIVNKQIVALQKEQSQLEEYKKSDTYANDKKSLAQIDKLLDDVKIKLDYAKEKAKGLSEATSETTKNQELLRVATAKVNSQYEKIEKNAKKIRLAVVAILVVVRKWVKETTEQATELYSLSKRYQASVEDIQKWNRALQLATGQSDLFTQSLSTMVKGFAQIAAGRGVAFTKALQNVGIAYKDIAELSAGEQFSSILEGLSNIENFSTRAAAAQQLFGESGQYIAQIFEQDQRTIDDYLESASRFGIISSENAQRLAELKFDLEAANSQLSLAKAELVIALVPALELLTQLIKVISPILKGLAEGFGRLGKFGAISATVFAGMLLIYPKLIALSRQHALQKQLEALAIKVTGDESLKAVPKLMALNFSLGAIGIAVVGLSTILALVGKKADQTADKLGNVVKEGQGMMGDTATDFTTNTEAYSTSNREYYINIEADITGKGDTAISDESAIKVAQLTADAINKSLGELTK